MRRDLVLRETLGPDLSLERLERGRLHVRSHELVQCRDDVLVARVGGEALLRDDLRAGSGDGLIVGMLLQPRQQTRAGVVVEVAEDEPGGARGACSRGS